MRKLVWYLFDDEEVRPCLWLICDWWHKCLHTPSIVPFRCWYEGSIDGFASFRIVASEFLKLKTALLATFCAGLHLKCHTDCWTAPVFLYCFDNRSDEKRLKNGHCLHLGPPTKVRFRLFPLRYRMFSPQGCHDHAYGVLVPTCHRTIGTTASYPSLLTPTRPHPSYQPTPEP